MTHTKGPWRLTPKSGEISSEDGWYIARAINVFTTEGKANAHLIASAPELLGALKLALSTITDSEAHMDTEAMAVKRDTAASVAIAVISKAEGNTQ